MEFKCTLWNKRPRYPVFSDNISAFNESVAKKEFFEKVIKARIPDTRTMQFSTFESQIECERILKDTNLNFSISGG